MTSGSGFVKEERKADDFCDEARSFTFRHFSFIGVNAAYVFAVQAKGVFLVVMIGMLILLLLYHMDAWHNEAGINLLPNLRRVGPAADCRNDERRNGIIGFYLRIPFRPSGQIPIAKCPQGLEFITIIRQSPCCRTRSGKVASFRTVSACVGVCTESAGFAPRVTFPILIFRI